MTLGIRQKTSQATLKTSSTTTTTTTTAMKSTQSDEASVSSNGYQPDSPSEDDGYYTSAVSVQHKVKRFFTRIPPSYTS